MRSVARLPFAVLLVYLACSVASPLFAQALTAAAMAERVDHHYNALHSLQVDFDQQYDGLGQHRHESGVLLLKKPGRMKWSYSEPPGKLFVLDGRAAYFYTPGQTEVQRVAAKNLEDLRSPLRFLLGHSEIGRELIGLEIVARGEDYVLSGVPRTMEQRLAALHFTVAANGTILAIKAEELDGSVSTFTFRGELANVPAKDEDFVFRAPAGTAIVDGLPPA